MTEVQPSLKSYMIDLEDGRNPLIRLIHEQELQQDTLALRKQKCMTETQLKKSISAAFIQKMKAKADEHRQTEHKIAQFNL